MKTFKDIFKAFFITKKKELYFNEIKEISSLSDSSLSRTLKEMLKLKILSQNKTKSNTFYKIKDKKRFELEFSILAHNKFNNLNINVKVPLMDFLKEIVNENIFTIVLFGSASIKKENKNSDIDLLIVSDKKIENLNDIIKKINTISLYPLSIFQCNIEEFKKKKDHIIKEAINSGFPIKGEQNFYALC